MLEHKLLKINVNEHTEKKQGLTYLSWAWAWAEALQVDPAAKFHVHTFDVDGISRPYMDVNGTGMVWVDVTLNGRTRTCWLPVMNHRNQPIQNPDAFQVNTALMRCMTKCLALFGLGLYIYAGEDLPEGATEPAQQAQETPKPATKGADTTAPEKPSEQDLANLNLFADGLLQFLHVAKDGKGLKSYWKANQTQIDRLKQIIPDRYAEIREKFVETSEKMKQAESAE